MSIVTRHALRENAAANLTWRLVADALGTGLDAYLRGYTLAELSGWRSYATKGETVDTDAMQAMQIAACVAVDDQGTLLFAGPSGKPDLASVGAVSQEIPPGAYMRLVRQIDALSGFGNGVPSLGEAPPSGESSPAGAATDLPGSRPKSTRKPAT